MQIVPHIKIKGSVILLSLSVAFSLLLLSAQRSEADSNDQAIDISFCELSPKNSASDLKQLKRKNPNHPGFHYQWGQYQFCQSNLPEAVAAYEQAITLDPKFAHAYLELGKIYEKQQQWDKAIAAYQKVIELDRNIGEVYPHLASLYKRQNRLQESEETLQKALPEFFASPFLARYSDPGYLEAKDYLKQGQQFLAQGQLLKAEPLLRKAVSLNPSNSDAAQALGTLFVKNNQPDKAIETVRHTSFYILKRNKDVDQFLTPEMVEMAASVESHTWVAQQYVEQGDLTTAINVLKKSQKILDQELQHLSNSAPSSENSFSRKTLARYRRQIPLEIGQLLVQQGNEKDAVEQLTTDDSFRQNVLAKLEQGSSDAVQNESRIQSSAYQQIGNTYLEQDQISNAIEAYKKALQLSPSNITVLSALGRVQLRFNQVPSALKTYRQSITQGAEKTRQKIALADVEVLAVRQAATELQRQQKPDAAIELLASGLKIPDANEQTLYLKADLVDALVQQEQYSRAVSLIQEIIAEKPTDKIDLYKELVDLYLKMEQFSEAEHVAKQMIKEFPEDVRGTRTLGEVYSHQNRLEQALTVLYYSRTLGYTRPTLEEIDEATLPTLEEFDNSYSGVNARHQLADLLIAQGKYEAAIAQYRKLAEINISSQEGLLYFDKIADLYMKQNRFAEAIPLLKAFLTSTEFRSDDHHRNRLQLLLGTAHTHERNYMKALAAFRLTREGPGLDGVIFVTYPKMSRDVLFYTNLGSVLWDLKRSNLALETMNVAIQLQPETSFPRYLRGNMYQEQGQFDQALQDYQVAIANISDNFKPGLTQTSLLIHPDLSDLYLNCGKILLQQNQPAQAQEKFEQALRTNPDNTEAKSLLNSMSSKGNS